MQPQRSTNRLITQNLLASASLCDNPDYVDSGSLDWMNIEDLAILIDLYCLYDKAVVIARRPAGTQHSARGIAAWDSNIVRLLTSKNFIEVLQTDSSKAEKVANVALEHLATVLKKKDTNRFKALFEGALTQDADLYSPDESWDPGSAASEGKLWLQTLPNQANVLQALAAEHPQTASWTSFFARTFVYLGHAQEYQIPLAVDVARVDLLNQILKRQAQRGVRWMAQADKRTGNVLADPLRTLQNHVPLDGVSLFACKVFHDAAKEGGQKEGRELIPKMMARVRDAVSDERERLRGIQERALWNWKSLEEQSQAKVDWTAELQAIDTKLSEPSLRWAPMKVKVARAAAWAEVFGDAAIHAAKVVEHPQSVEAGVSAAVFGIGALSLAGMINWLHERPVIELRRIKRRLPGSRQLEADIRTLFGEVRESAH